MDETIKTPETHPDHWVVGHFFKAWNGEIYFCDSYDLRIGYWMTNIKNSEDRRNVSERAPRGTYHEIYSFEPKYAEVVAIWEETKNKLKK